MRVDFDDESFVEIRLNGPGQIAVILGAKDRDNPLKFVTNSCVLSIQQFSELISELPVQLTKPKNALKKIDSTKE